MSAPHPAMGDVYLTNTGFFFSPFLSQAVEIKSACIESEVFIFSLFLQGGKTNFSDPKHTKPPQSHHKFPL